MPHVRFSFKAKTDQEVDFLDFTLRLFQELNSGYITALPPGPKSSKTMARSFYIIRALLTALQIIEIPYQIFIDYQLYREADYLFGKDYSLNITCMLMVQAFGLMGVWGPNLAYLGVFCGFRFFMADDQIGKNDLYGLVHLTTAVYAAVLCGFTWKAYKLGM